VRLGPIVAAAVRVSSVAVGGGVSGGSVGSPGDEANVGVAVGAGGSVATGGVVAGGSVAGGAGSVVEAPFAGTPIAIAASIATTTEDPRHVPA
jgi:hypothetical protein